MKVKEAYEDKTGFHYVIELADGTEKLFNYSPAPGVVSVGKVDVEWEGQVVLDSAGVPVKIPVFVAESKSAYVERIENEIEATVAELPNVNAVTPITFVSRLGLKG